MKRWLKRVRGAVGMGLTWALGWALAGLVIGVASITDRRTAHALERRLGRGFARARQIVQETSSAWNG